MHAERRSSFRLLVLTCWNSVRTFGLLPDQFRVAPTLFHINREMQDACGKTIFELLIFSNISLLLKFWKEKLLFQKIKVRLTQLLELPKNQKIDTKISGWWSALLAQISRHLHLCITTQTSAAPMSLHTWVFQNAPHTAVLVPNALGDGYRASAHLRQPPTRWPSWAQQPWALRRPASPKCIELWRLFPCNIC